MVTNYEAICVHCPIVPLKKYGSYAALRNHVINKHPLYAVWYPPATVRFIASP